MLKFCPLCRSDRGYADTVKMNGIEDLLEVVGQTLNVPAPPDSRELPELDLNAEA